MDGPGVEALPVSQVFTCVGKRVCVARVFDVHFSEGGPGTGEAGCSRGVRCGWVVRTVGVLWGRVCG